jgi:hypothetical protein
MNDSRAGRAKVNRKGPGCVRIRDAFSKAHVCKSVKVIMANKDAQRGFPRFLLIWILVPFILGYVVSRVHLDVVESFLKPHFDRLFPRQNPAPQRLLIQSDDDGDDIALRAVIKDCVETKLPNALFPRGGKDLSTLANVRIDMHRNGESESCGLTPRGAFVDSLKHAVEAYVHDFKQCPTFDKYSTESLLTRSFRELLDKSCPSPESDRSIDLGLYGFCDMGESRTPILLDHMKLVPISFKSGQDENVFLPCHFHTVSSMPNT